MSRLASYLCLIIGMMTAGGGSAWAQDSAPVAFLDKTPVIDGVLDEGLQNLAPRKFNHVFKFDNPAVPPITVTYRLGYTPTHLYLYIETDADEVSYHRRGYVWGDGYKLLLGLPQQNGSTNEYYDMAFSPTAENASAKGRERILAYNFVQGARSFSDLTRSQAKSAPGATGFEALIAWDDIKPYHPWFIPEMGYNLYFAKGFDTPDHGHFPYGYAVVEDEGIWDEELDRRNYAPLKFAIPDHVSSEFFSVRPTRRHLLSGDALGLDIIALTAKQKKTKLKLEIYNAAGKAVFKRSKKIICSRRPKLQHFEFDFGAQPVGLYKVKAAIGDTVVETDFSILPGIGFAGVDSSLAENSGHAPEGASATLRFKLRELQRKLNDLKSYEQGAAILSGFAEFKKEYAVFQAGDDPYAGRKGPYRRAFKSKQDGSFQPYTIKLPENFDSEKTYPLLVFLHGSGQDEQKLLNRRRGDGRFIELAPYGRDKYQAYASDESQTDIVEAINDAVENFPIAKDKIVIGGFSMGGYGALLAFYAHPQLYRGVAVFAGHPNLATEWLDEPHPNFLEKKYLAPFANADVFLYHGKKDAALDIRLIEQMAVKMEDAGARVTTRFVDGRGHQYQDDETQAVYSRWLEEAVRD